MEKQKKCVTSCFSITSILKIIYNVIENLLAWMFAVIFILCCITVILRYLFNTSIYGAQEIVEYMFIYLSALGAPLLIQTDEHIKVDFFTNSPKGFYKVLKAIQHVIVIALQVFLLSQSMNWIRQVGGFLTPLLHIEQRWVQYAIPACMILSILFSIGQLIVLFSVKTTREVASQ